MPKKLRYARIAITLPEDELASADRLATSQSRSRSWVIAEAIRRYAASAAPAASTAADETGLGSSRKAQLLADMALTPEERVRVAEETARFSFLLRPPLGKSVLAFDRYEDYLKWKRREAAGG